MDTVLLEIGPPVLVIVLGLAALGLWKTVNHRTSREQKAKNTDPLF